MATIIISQLDDAEDQAMIAPAGGSPSSIDRDSFGPLSPTQKSPSKIKTEREKMPAPNTRVPHSDEIKKRFEDYRNKYNSGQKDVFDYQDLLDQPIENLVNGETLLAPKGTTLRQYIDYNIRKNRRGEKFFQKLNDTVRDRTGTKGERLTEKEQLIETETFLALNRLLERERKAHENQNSINSGDRANLEDRSKVMLPAESLLALVSHYTRNPENNKPQSNFMQTQNSLLPYLASWKGHGGLSEKELEKIGHKAVEVPLPANPDGTSSSGHWGDGAPEHDKAHFIDAAWKKFSADNYKYDTGRYDEKGKKVYENYNIDGAIAFYDSELSRLGLKDPSYFPVNKQTGKSNEEVPKEYKQVISDTIHNIAKQYPSIKTKMLPDNVALFFKPFGVKSLNDDVPTETINKIIGEINLKSKIKDKIREIPAFVPIKNPKYTNQLYERLTLADMAIGKKGDAEANEKLKTNRQFRTTIRGGVITQESINPASQAIGPEYIERLLNLERAQDATIIHSPGAGGLTDLNNINDDSHRTKHEPSSTEGEVATPESSGYSYGNDDEDDYPSQDEDMKANFFTDSSSLDQDAIDLFNKYLNPIDDIRSFNKNILTISNEIFKNDPIAKEWSGVLSHLNSGTSNDASKTEAQFTNKYFGLKGQKNFELFKRAWLMKISSWLTVQPKGVLSKLSHFASVNTDKTIRLSNFISRTKIILGQP